jgi:hypothetical protein
MAEGVPGLSPPLAYHKAVLAALRTRLTELPGTRVVIVSEGRGAAIGIVAIGCVLRTA